MLIRLLLVLFAATAYAAPEETTHQKKAVISSVKVAHSPGPSNIYWHLKQDNALELSGLLRGGESQLLVNVTFFPNQLTTVTYNCDKADKWTCAEIKVDVTDYFPSGYDNVVTVFSTHKDGVKLSFEIPPQHGKNGPNKEIVAGVFSKDSR